MKKIDIFPHIFPKPFFDTMVEVIPNKAAVRRWLNIPVLYDLDARLRLMEEFGPDYQQILTLSMPAIEYMAPPDKSPDLAKLANDGMAEIVAKHRNRFPAFAASVPMNNVKAALAEIERAIEKLDARGIQIMTNVNGRPLDDPEFAPIFQKMHDYDLPIWMHPTRPQKFADYPGESGSKFDIWWCFGWPYETSAAMARMVFSGFFDRWPNLKDHYSPSGRDGAVPGGACGVGLRPTRFARRRAGGIRRDHRQYEKEGPPAGRLFPNVLRRHRNQRLARPARAAASNSSAQTMCCSAPIARSIRWAGRSSSATSSKRWTVSNWTKATGAKFMN